MSAHSAGRAPEGGCRWAQAVTLVLLASPALGCQSVFDELLDVPVPDRVIASTLDDPAQASLLVDGARELFHCALGAHIVMFGIIVDELTGIARDDALRQWDRRAQDPAGGIGGQYVTGDCASGSPSNTSPYRPTNSARWFTDDVLANLESWTDAEVADRQLFMASMGAYAGYSHVLLGEGYCSSAIDEGPELTPQEVFQRGEGKFTTAIQAAQQGGADSLLNMAYAGRARLRLNMGDVSGAMSDAQQVPKGFVKMRSAVAPPASLNRQNPIWRFVTQNGWAIMDTTLLNVTWMGAPDPRIPVFDTGNPSDLGNFLDQTKYPNGGSSIPIARWEEAQLIMAEVQGGQAAVDILDTLHARAGIPPTGLAAGDAAGISSHIIQERRREFLLEGHRVADVLRLGIQLTPPAGTPHPFGGSYGDTICLPLPNVERNANPNIADS